MGLDYAGIYNLWHGGSSLNARVQVALLKYAQYLRARGLTATAAQQTWCQSMLRTDNQVQADAREAMKFVCSDVATIAADGNLTDAQVQTIVETWVNNILLAA